MKFTTKVKYGIVGTTLATGLLCSVTMGQNTGSNFRQLCRNEPSGAEYNLCVLEKYSNMVTNLLRANNLTPQTVKCNSDILLSHRGTCSVIAKEYENAIKVTYTKDGKLVHIEENTSSTITSGRLYIRPNKEN